MHYIFMSHGPMAAGTLETAEMILGKQEDVAIISISIDSNIETTLEELKSKTAGIEDELLIVTDIIGGTPFNAAYKYLALHPKARIVTGLNLPMVIQLLMERHKSLDELAAHIEANVHTFVSVVSFQEETVSDEEAIDL